MEIYLAGPCDSENRSLMISAAKLLRERKIFNVYCPWELKIENAWDISQEEWAKKVFDNDIKAIDNCDIVIMISLGRESTAGTNWECGYAFANKKKLIVIQITDKPTSLMTFCGCTYFINSSVNNLRNDLLHIIIKILNNDDFKNNSNCRTVLT